MSKLNSNSPCMNEFRIRRAPRRGPIPPFPPVQVAVVWRRAPPAGRRGRSAMASDGRDVRRIGIRAAGLFTVTSTSSRRDPGESASRSARYSVPRSARVGDRRRRCPACTPCVSTAAKRDGRSAFCRGQNRSRGRPARATALELTTAVSSRLVTCAVLPLAI